MSYISARQPFFASSVGLTQIELEELHAKSQLLPALREDYRPEIEAQLIEMGINVEFALDLLAQAWLHKQAPVETFVGILRHHFETEAKPAQACADAIWEACEVDLVDYDPQAGEMGRIFFKHAPTAETQARIARFQYPLPMIEKPQEVRHNRQTGYRTIKDSLILKNNHHDEDICLDHINRVNGIKLKLNPDVVAFVQNSWKNLDKRKPGETREAYQKRVKAFHKYDTDARDVIDAMLLQGDGFWVTHRYDKRGRTYAAAYHCNYQGNDWSKAVIEFAQAEPLKDS